MKNQQYSAMSAADLRRRAEERLQSQATDSRGPQSEAERQQWIHELQVRQIELEMQNQELHESRAKLEEAAKRNNEFYGCAPVPYLAVAPNGEITQANSAAVDLLRFPPSELIGKLLADFVAEEGRSTFNAFLTQTFTIPTKHICEVTLNVRAEFALVVQIDAIRTIDGKECLAVLHDITDRKRDEEKLRENMERFRLAVQASNVGIMDWDLRTDQIVFSHEWTTLLGHSANEIGNDFSEWKRYIHPDDLPPMANRLQVYLACPEEGYAVEFRMRHNDGSWRWMFARGEVLRDSSGRPLRILGCHVDITERKSAETALRTSQELNSAIMDHFPGLISAKDLVGNYIMVNRGFRVIAGPDPASFVGKNVFDLFPKDIATALWENDLAAQRAGRALQSEELVLHKDGDIHTYRTTKLPLYKNNELFSTCAISFDITDVRQAEKLLRMSEEKYRSIFENAAEGMFRTTPEGRFLELNPALARILGYASPCEVLEELGDIGGLLFVDSERRREFMRLMESTGSVSGFEFEIHRKDGSTAWVRESARAVRDAAGVIQHYEGTVEDITERRQAEEAQRQANVRLTALSRRILEIQEAERRHLARELHDEIGQVLTAVYYNLSALKTPRDPNSPSRLDDSLAIVDNAIQQVRTMSLDLRPSMLDDLGLAATVKWYANHLAERTGLTIHMAAPPAGVNLPPEVTIACFRVAQEAMTNIVRHACAREAWIELDQGEEEVRLFIRDDGVGFDLTEARRRAIHGGSVGLLGMQERIELIGGQFLIESNIGMGTSIQIRFVLQQVMEKHAITDDPGGTK